MTHVATQGTSSCACISIGGFKNGPQIKINEEYKSYPENYIPPKSGKSVNEFYSRVLYPVSQPLGCTYDMPFQKMMEEINKSDLRTKLITAVLNQNQITVKEGYWKEELENWGFKLVTKTKNSIGGSVNYLYIRNPNEVE